MTAAVRQEHLPAHGKSVLLALGRYNPTLHEGVARFAGQHGWHLNAEMAYFGRLPRGWQGDGIITLLDTETELIQFVQSAKSPVVDLSVIRDDIKLPRVAGDHRRIGQLGAEHFLERGFRHFAWFSTLDDNVTRLRWLGYSQALGRAGFRGECWTFTPKAAEEWIDKRDFLIRRLTAIGKPVAVACFRDADAANVLDACDEANLSVPDEVAILGADNNALICETVRVPLSSVNHDLLGLGYEGAALLHQLMLGRRVPKRLKLIPPKGITVRHSTDVLAIQHEPLRKAMRHLKQNCAQPFSLDDTAAATSLPRRRLERAFREHLGRSMIEELARMRLQHAKAMLVESNFSMADIAAKAGFNTAQYFNNVFRRATGLTPRRYRLRFRKANPTVP